LLLRHSLRFKGSFEFLNICVPLAVFSGKNLFLAAYSRKSTVPILSKRGIKMAFS
jgi:hypothetical protein